MYWGWCLEYMLKTAVIMFMYILRELFKYVPHCARKVVVLDHTLKKSKSITTQHKATCFVCSFQMFNLVRALQWLLIEY
jgi:hypothetical protein